MKHRSDVGSLSCQVTLKPVSTRLQGDIRFFRLPTPASLTVYLAAHLLLIEEAIRGYHVPCKYLIGLGPVNTPGVQNLRRIRLEIPALTASPFGSSLSALFGLFELTTLQQFTYVDHTNQF